jgi:hypothetical protein
MGPSLSHPARPAHDPEGRARVERLGGFCSQQLTEGMIWLSGYAPRVFDAVLDAVEPSVGDGSEEPAPFCSQCGADIGIFLKFGLGWRHYKGTTLSEIELFEPGHAPVVAWRVGAAAPI